MPGEYSLSVIIPVYNEIGALKASLLEIGSFLAAHFRDYEMLVVESGSTDGSSQACDELAREDPHIRVIHEGARNGFGSALKLGYRLASKDLIWLVTVDLPFPLESILAALPFFGRFDCVLSYRSEDNRSVLRKFQSLIYNLVIRSFLRIRVKHVNSAFKVYKRAVLQSLDIQSNNWFIDAEVIYWLTQKGIPYTEIPVALVDRTTGKSSTGVFTFVAVLGELYRFLKKVDRRS